MEVTVPNYFLHVGVGVTSLLLVTIFVPGYVRILWIFLGNKSYRSLECYQIMIQIGIAQTMTGPSWFFTGLAHITQHDYGRLAEWSYKLTGAMVRAEALLSVLLAVNRLRIICNWKLTHVVKEKSQFKIMYAACSVVWIWSFIPLGVFVSGAADFLVNPKEFLPRYDYSKPYSKLLQDFGSNQLIATSLITLVLYLVTVTYLVYSQCKVGISSEFKKEKAILAHALARFVFEFSAAVLYNLGKYFLPVSDYVSIFVFFTYPFNNLVLPPLLYLTLYKYGP
ncbi:hypothetical protein QR680_009979 [Steinernema hermaphroditum]|uniref:Uncharacterized protein n=1 Tax=Steinernema hermaphroditum TaxID=289476 RepID=A0AA39INN3_9BILA|nr:hypothetical protein QR680_009979 [Steinernema hermaphroditum]